MKAFLFLACAATLCAQQAFPGATAADEAIDQAIKIHLIPGAVLLVDHDISLVLTTCDKVTVLDRGQVIASGTPAEIRGDERVRKAYLG